MSNYDIVQGIFVLFIIFLMAAFCTILVSGAVILFEMAFL